LEGAVEVLREDNVVRPASIEILSTEDERIRTIGEVLTNDTEREILCKVCEGSNTALDISESLRLDLSLVARHLKKLVTIGLVKVAEVSASQKGRPVKIYAPSKMVLIIVPGTQMEELGEKTIIRSLISALPKMLALLTFVLTTITAFTLLTNLLQPGEGIPMWSGEPASYPGLALVVLISAVVGGLLTLILQSRLSHRENT
jgi:DNA-binding transcriptional ArsR family regulator